MSKVYFFIGNFKMVQEFNYVLLFHLNCCRVIHWVERPLIKIVEFLIDEELLYLFFLVIGKSKQIN